MTLSEVRCTECDRHHDPEALLGVCGSCGAPLSARYDPTALRERVRRPGALPLAGMWDYAEVLPVAPARPPVSLGEGATPLVPLPALARRFGLDALLLKDEAREPTGSFKARGMSAAVTAARDRGARRLAAPSAGNAAGALAAYARRAGLECSIAIPSRAPAIHRLEVRALATTATLVDGTIADAALALRGGHRVDAFDVSTTREPYRVDGKKTMGWELFEQTGGRMADWLLYPTGGGTGLLGIDKARDEIEQALERRVPWPRFVAVQSETCCPVVRAFERRLDRIEAHHRSPTVASGLEVPRPFADRWLLRVLRRNSGAAVAVTDDEILAAIRDTAEREGVLLCPEAAATVAALGRLRDAAKIAPGERAILFQTASPYKYAEVIERAFSR